MDIRIKATDYHVTPDVQEYLDQKIESIKKFLKDVEDVARVEVELGRDAGGQQHGKNMWFAEIQVLVPGRDRVYARNNSESVPGAIDDVKDEVERQLRRGQQMHRRVLRKSGAMLKRLMRFGQE